MATLGTNAAGRERTSPRLPLVKNTLSFYFTEQPEGTVTDADQGGGGFCLGSGLNPPASPRSAGQVTLSEAELSLWGHTCAGLGRDCPFPGPHRGAVAGWAGGSTVARLRKTQVRARTYGYVHFRMPGSSGP